MKPMTPASRSGSAWFGRSAAWVTALCCGSALAQSLAPNPMGGHNEPPAPNQSVPVRVILLPGGAQMLERTDAPSAPDPAFTARQRSTGQAQDNRYRVVSAQNGAKMLEPVDAARAPASEVDPGRLITHVGPGGVLMLRLRDEMVAQQNPGPPLPIVDIAADGQSAATLPRDPGEKALYRVVRPSTRP